MQESRLAQLITISLLLLSITSCAPYRPASGKAAICNQLNSQMIFEGVNGGTSNTRQAEIQSAEAPLLYRNYDQDNCATSRHG